MEAENRAYFEGAVIAGRVKELSEYSNHSHRLNYDKEHAQIMHAIDRFFGTINGATLATEELVQPGGTTVKVKKVDNRFPNVISEMGRLQLLLCGGAINSTFTNMEINDLDFYMMDPNLQPEIEDFFQRYFEKSFSSSNAITYKRKGTGRKVYTVQLITRFTGTPKEIFEWFDFTITHGAYNFWSSTFEFGDRFFQDLSKRRLVYSGASKYPICAMYRTKKYVDRGYDLPGATIMHIALSIVQLKIENYKDLKDQLMGIDTSYLQKLLDAKDPTNPVNYGEFIYEAFQVIDRITAMTAAEEEDHE